MIERNKLMATECLKVISLLLRSRYVGKYKFALATPKTQKLLYSTEKRRDAGLLEAYR